MFHLNVCSLLQILFCLVFVWHVRTVKLLMISGASRSPLMTAFAELIQRADPPSVPYHRVSGLRGRNPLWYIPIALHLLLFSLKGKYKVEFRDSKNPRACTAQNSRQIRISVLYKLTLGAAPDYFYLTARSFVSQCTQGRWSWDSFRFCFFLRGPDTLQGPCPIRCTLCVCFPDTPLTCNEGQVWLP